MTNTKTINSYAAMMSRCYDKNDMAYNNYGGAGIKVCKRWRKGDGNLSGSECFIKDMGIRPSNKTLDRWPDNKGNYKPSNCRWATAKEQNSNRKDNKFVLVDNEKYTIADAARKLKIPTSTVHYRYNAGEAIFYTKDKSYKFNRTKDIDKLTIDKIIKIYKKGLVGKNRSGEQRKRVKRGTVKHIMNKFNIKSAMLYKILDEYCSM